METDFFNVGNETMNTCRVKITFQENCAV